MATTLPTVYPTGYQGTNLDFLETKVDRSGALRIVTGDVSIPATTATTVLIGLLPFNKGAKVFYGSSVHSADLDTSTNVTLNVGWTYYDSATGTSQAAGFISASTIPQAGGSKTFDNTTGFEFTALGDGWITAGVGAATTTTGSLQFNVGIAYDASGVTNP